MNLCKRNIVIIYLICVGAFLCSCDSNESNNKLQIETRLDKVEETTVTGLICVYVVGEVITPGVYELPEGARICDVIEAAGGFTDAADREYINLASEITDGEKIIVYSITQVENNEITTESSSSLVNINTADVERLMSLPGIGESRANDIINYREKNGKFETIEDIMNVSGIKEAAFSKIEDLITVD